MARIRRRITVTLLACFGLLLGWQSAYAQKISLAFSSVDSPKANWYIAKERQLFKKYGLDADLVFIPSSTTTISAACAIDSEIADPQIRNCLPQRRKDAKSEGD